MDAVIEQMNQVRDTNGLRYDVFRRWATYLRDVVQPQLDELAALKAATEMPTLKKGAK